MKSTLIVIAILILGCGTPQAQTFSISVSTFNRASKTYSDTGSNEFATAGEVRSVIASIDWTSGDTRSAINIMPSSQDSELHVQHDLKAHDVHITASWKVPDQEKERFARLPDENAVLLVVDAFTRGRTLRGLADWSNLDDDIDVRGDLAEQ